MVVSQTAEDIGCEILSPLECTLYYDPQGDVLHLLNRAPALALHVRTLALEGDAEEVIGPRKTAALHPGSHRLWVQDSTMAFLYTSTLKTQAS